MQVVYDIINWIVVNGPAFISAAVGVLTALIVLFALIPGEQPEKFLQGVVDWIKKYSAK